MRFSASLLTVLLLAAMPLSSRAAPPDSVSASATETPRLEEMTPQMALEKSKEMAASERSWMDYAYDLFESLDRLQEARAENRVEKWVSYDDLQPLVKEFNDATERRIRTVNVRLAEVEAAARACDRTEYDAALHRLIRAYVEASLYIQRNMDQFHALMLATVGLQKNIMTDAPVLGIGTEARYRWSIFWASVLENLASNEGEPVKDIKTIWSRLSLSHRAGIMGLVYEAHWKDTLVRIEKIIDTADYPRFPDDCGENGETEPLPPAADDDAVLEAQRDALDAFEGEVAEMEAQAGRLSEAFEAAVEAIPARAPPEKIAALPLPDTSYPAGPMTAIPNTDAALPDPSAYAVPDTNLPRIEAPASGPLADMRADPCSLDPVKVCTVLLEEFRGACTRELTGFLAICRKGPSLTDCAARCEGNWQQGKHDLALGELAQAHIRRVADASDTGSEKEAERMLAEIEANKERMADIKAAAAKRVVNIYVNEETDTVIRHYGRRFTPHPPLRFAGTAGGELYLGERMMLAGLEEKNRFLEKEIDRLIDKAGSGWARKAASRWGTDPSAAPGRCDARQNDANRDACLASCKGAAPAQTVNVCHASIVPHLAAPYGRAWLYPPGDPSGPVTGGPIQP